MKLRAHVPKASGAGDRELSLEETVARMVPHLRRMGITRLADITGLDRIGIPVHNAICPRSADVISVYNGKGSTHLAARTSAIMEATERFSASLPRAPVAIASYPEVQRGGLAVLDPRACCIELFRGYDIEMPISWLEGYDLMNERGVLVPMYLAGYYLQFHETPCYPIATTNGIASGNSREEAICHALAELIERDDWTIADLISNRLSQVLAGDTLGLAPDETTLHHLHPAIDIQTLPPRALRLAEMFESAGLRLELRNLTSQTGIPTILASVSEDVAPSFSHSHQGLGTAPDAEVAVVRAITEAAQSRAVDISAIREDIAMPGEPVHRWSLHAKRTAAVDSNSWALGEATLTVPYSDVPSHPSDDIASDIHLMLARLRSRGLDEAIVVDLSPPGVPVSVVRVIVPGAESWIVDRSSLGPRARAVLGSLLEMLLPDAPETAAEEVA